MAEIENLSGLSNDDVAVLLADLAGDRRVVECISAAAAGQRADIGFFIKSKIQPFYDAGVNPIVPGFAPAVIFEGDWDASDMLTPGDAAVRGNSANGYVTACGVNLSDVVDIPAFFRKLLEAFGPVQIAPQFTPSLAKSVPYIAADQATLAKPVAAGGAGNDYDGRGTTVCVIDMGCDFAHRNFRIPKAGELPGQLLGSRLLNLLVMAQNGTATVYPRNGSTVPEMNIENWIADPSPYTKSPYKPHDLNNNCVDPEVGGSHGTLVLDIAAGNGNGTRVKGMAPGADLCFVQVYVSDTDGRRYVSGDQILNGVKKARIALDLDNPASNRPTVFNISLGTNDGPHDATDHGKLLPGGTEKAWNVRLDNIFTNQKGRALVWSAGNQFRGGLHATGSTKREAGTTSSAIFDIRVPSYDHRSNEIKIWFDKPLDVDVLLQARLVDYKGATGAMPAPVEAPGNLFDEAPRAAGAISAAAKYGDSSTLHYFTIRLDPFLSRPGVNPLHKRWETWRLQITGKKLDGTGTEIDFAAVNLQAWIERDDTDQVAFRRPPPVTVANPNSKIEPLGTLSADAAGVRNAIVVGAISTATYVPGSLPDALGVGHIMPFSSAGPNRTGDRRPHVCAPGEIIMGAKSLGDPVANGTGFGLAGLTAMSGTSMAAPHVAGLVALLFDQLKRAGAAYPAGYPIPAPVPGVLPVADNTRDRLINAARPNVAGGTNPIQWEPQRGFGCVDAVKLLKP